MKTVRIIVEFHAFPCEDQLAVALVSQLAHVRFHNAIEAVVDACAKEVLGGRIGTVQTCIDNGPQKTPGRPKKVVGANNLTSKTSLKAHGNHHPGMGPPLAPHATFAVLWRQLPNPMHDLSTSVLYTRL